MTMCAFLNQGRGQVLFGGATDGVLTLTGQKVGERTEEWGGGTVRMAELSTQRRPASPGDRR